MEVPVTKQNLQIETTVAFAKATYADAKTQTAETVLAHCMAAARLAEAIAQKLFRDMRGDVIPQDSQDIVESIVHAAVLSEAININRRTFEQIADITNVQIASMVSALTRDLRLVETKRDIEYRGRLSISPLSTQIVAVAAIICTANSVVKLLTAQNILAIPIARKILAQLDGDLLAAHATSRYYTLRLYAHAARNLIADANQIIKKLKADARTARMVEKSTAGIRMRQAAKKAVTSDNQEPKRGRKRSVK
jgi:hypothetical protein